MKTLTLKTINTYKEAYSGHPTQVWALAIFTLINRMGSMILPFLMVYLTTVLHFSLEDAGFLASAFGIGGFAGSYIGGKLADKIGPNLVIVGSLIMGGLMLFFLQYVTTFEWLFVSILAASLFGEAYRPAVTVTVSNYVPKTATGRSMALVRLAMNLGFSAAPAIGGFVAATLGYHWMFWIDGGTCIAAGLYFAYASRNWEKHGQETPVANAESKPAASISAHRNLLYVIFLGANFLIGLTFIQWFQSIPLFIRTEWAFDERYIGIIMGMNGLLITLIEMPIVHSIEKAGLIRRFMPLGIGLVGLSFIPFFFPKALFLCFFAMFIMTVGEILYLPFASVIAVELSPADKRGEYMAWYSMMWSLTNIAGPIVGMAFIAKFGYDWFWLLLLALNGTGLGLYFLLRQKMDMNSYSLSK